MVFGFLALYKLDGDDCSCFKRANFLIKLAVVCVKVKSIFEPLEK